MQPSVHAIMRHATAPGCGDPEGFVLGNCKAQRNLRDKTELTGVYPNSGEVILFKTAPDETIQVLDRIKSAL